MAINQVKEKAFEAACAALEHAIDLIASATITPETITIEKLSSRDAGSTSAAFGGAKQSFMRGSAIYTYNVQSGQADMVFENGKKGHLGLTSWYDYNQNQYFNIRIFHPDFTINVYPGNCLMWQSSGPGTGGHPISWNNILKQTHLEMLNDNFFQIDFAVGGENIKEIKHYDYFNWEAKEKEHKLKAAVIQTIGQKFETIQKKVEVVEKRLTTAVRQRESRAVTTRGKVVTHALAGFLEGTAGHPAPPQG